MKTSRKPVLTELRPLNKLIGNWKVSLRWSKDTHRLVGGPKEVKTEARISTLKEGKFLHYKLGSAHWVIGGDESDHHYTALYSDERLISRVYRMSYARDVWKIWRNAPKFNQRFKGRIRADGRRIDGRWEKSVDGKSWVHDFDMTFVR